MKVCVFLGSRQGRNANYAKIAHQLGGLFAANKIDLVFGGGTTGLMGVLANATLEAGGRVIGVVPSALAHKVTHSNEMDQLHIVQTMHERKALMAELADAFIALPGGIGTLEELFEAWTWNQLGFHRKPCAILNIDKFYDSMVYFIDHMVSENFLPIEHRDLIFINDSPIQLVDHLISLCRPDASSRYLFGLSNESFN